MCKYLIIGDTHCGAKASSKLYHEVIFKFFNYVIDYCQQKGIKKMIHTGDFFDNRKTLSLSTIELASVTLGPLINDYFDESYIIIGNHDIYYEKSLEPTSLSLLRAFPKINIIDSPKKIDNIALLPWLFDEFPSADILIGHLDINGIRMNSSGSVSKGHKYNTSDFSNYKMVISGHYHTPGIYGNIQYVGTPYQLTFGDVNSTRGFHILDTDTLSLEFIEFTEYPHHILVKDTDDININDITGNNVKLIFTDDYGIDKNSEIINKIKDMNPASFSYTRFGIQETFTEDELSESDEDLMDNIEILISFISKSDLPEGIKQPILLKLVDKISKEIV